MDAARAALRASALVLAAYLGAWMHEGAHTAQAYASDGSWAPPYVFPLTAADGCWLGDATGHHTSIPGTGCTDSFAAYEANPAPWEAMAYVLQAFATALYASVLHGIRRGTLTKGSITGHVRHRERLLSGSTQSELTWPCSD